MCPQGTPTAGETPTDPHTVLLDILHHAVSQDGTLDTAMESLHTIEDLALAGLRLSCRHYASSFKGDVWVCMQCGDIVATADEDDFVAALR